MTRLIDADRLLNEFNKQPCETFKNGIECLLYFNSVMWTIDEQPTVDAVPKGAYEQVKWERDMAIRQLNDYGVQLGEKADLQAVRHGKIIETIKDGKYHREFSCCGSKCTQLTMWVKPLYCIYCGAKMG